MAPTSPWRAASLGGLVRPARLVVLSALSGVLAGASSWVFLEVLDRITDVRLDHGWLLWLLPLAGLVIGAVYHHVGGRSGQGNVLLIEQIHEPTEWVPRRMAPLVLVGTWATHLFGGSAGREGTALQMSGSLTDAMSRLFRVDREDRRILLTAALGGGFGAVFGVPVAGAIFGIEVQSRGRIRHQALAPALIASIVGDRVIHALGHDHALRPQLAFGLEPWPMAKLAVAGLALGVTALVFVRALHAVKARLGRWVGYPPLRPFIGGVAIVGLAVVFGRKYLGLSLPLVDQALAGDRLAMAVFALKLLFTVVTLGAGFPGGEVTPLFVIGATLGAALATPLGLDVRVLAAVGFVAVFAGAAGTPIACTVMAVELFGAGMLVPAAIVCVVARVVAGSRSIYDGAHVPKRRLFQLDP